MSRPTSSTLRALLVTSALLVLVVAAATPSRAQRRQPAAPAGTTAGQKAARGKLLQKGATFTPESFLAYASQPDMVRLFLDAGMAPDALAPGMEETVLFYVARTECDDDRRPTAEEDALTVIPMLIAAGADPNWRGPNGNVPLTGAYRCAALAEALLRGGARIDGPSPREGETSGRYVMDAAISFERADMVRVLIAHGYDVPADGARLLELSRDRPAIQEILRSAGAAPAAGRTARSGGTRTPEQARRELTRRQLAFTQEGFWGPLMEYDADLVTLYLDAGIAPGARRDPPQDDTPLLFVTSGGCALHDEDRRAAAEQIALALIAHEADVNAKDVNNTTPLTHAAGGCPATVVRALLAAGASTSAKSRGGATPMMMAVIGGHTENVRALVEGGYDVSGELASLLPLASDARITTLLKQAAARKRR